MLTRFVFVGLMLISAVATAQTLQLITADEAKQAALAATGAASIYAGIKVFLGQLG